MYMMPEGEQLLFANLLTVEIPFYEVRTYSIELRGYRNEKLSRSLE